MLFNSVEFWAFFAIVAWAAHLVPARWSRLLLVIASFAFYGAFSPELVVLLAGCIVFNYGTGIAIDRAPVRYARCLLVATVITDLGLLGFFKYFGFFSGILRGLLHVPEATFALEIVLPVGISFFTFEAISYNVDIYRHTGKARTNLIDFALFMSFFPHLVAGPIIRPDHFFPQLEGRPIPSDAEVRWSAVQIIKGLIKKTVFADNFATVANAYFNGSVGHGDMLMAWLATLAFSMQIYFDFSGYTDIARGCAQLLGYRFPSNFERPYLAHDIAEFWRRWHISLSMWLRDYLYIPLGGNRRGNVRTYVNILVTMVLGGLWHGASWNFVVWGLYQGVLLALHRGWRELRGGYSRSPGRIGDMCSVALTFMLVTLGWVTFRAPDFGTTWQVLGDQFGGSFQAGADVPRMFTVLIVTIAVWLMADRDRRLQGWITQGEGVLGTMRAPATLAVALLVLELFSRSDVAVPFIYFRF